MICPLYYRKIQNLEVENRKRFRQWVSDTLFLWLVGCDYCETQFQPKFRINCYPECSLSKSPWSHPTLGKDELLSACTSSHSQKAPDSLHLSLWQSLALLLLRCTELPGVWNFTDLGHHGWKTHAGHMGPVSVLCVLSSLWNSGWHSDFSPLFHTAHDWEENFGTHQISPMTPRSFLYLLLSSTELNVLKWKPYQRSKGILRN